MSNCPRVTIGLPVYQGERFLGEAIDSVLAQSFSDFELLISDNASSDRSVEIAEAACARDERVRLIRQKENLGAAPNYNLLVEQARGEFFKWTAHDDLIAPTFLQRCVEALELAGRRAVLAFPRQRNIDAAGQLLQEQIPDCPWRGGRAAVRLADLLDDRLHSFLHSCHPVVGLIRTEVLRRTPMIASFPSSDAALLVELALHGEWIPIEEPLFLRRLHEGSSLSANHDPSAVANWFDTRNRSRSPLGRTKLYASHIAALWRAPLPLGEKLRCLPVLWRRLWRSEWRVIAGELRRAAFKT